MDSTGSLEFLPPHDYQGQFHWHDGHGRLTIDACSTATSNGSAHPMFSADFAYHSLPIILGHVLQARSKTRGSLDSPAQAPSPSPDHMHELAQPEFLHIPSPATTPLGRA
jgi:hypothetical protein